MHIGLIDVDSKIPNLALMKLSAWHKKQGHTVTLLHLKDVFAPLSFWDNPDKLYAAVVFRKNRRIGLRLAHMGVNVGGTGWWLYKSLPAEIESMKPDYDLYGIDYGMGFLSRGCIWQCGPCVVWRKEGHIRSVAWPDELKNPRSNEMVLLDGCFNASPFWKEKALQIIKQGYSVDFTQGLSIRLIDKEQAELIAAMNHTKRIHFAFDHIDLEPQVRKGIEILLSQGIHPDRLSFYILTNYDSTFEQDLRRIEILDEYGVNSFVMVYDKDNAPQQLRHLARWCNKYQTKKSCKFEDYDPNYRSKKHETVGA